MEKLAVGFALLALALISGTSAGVPFVYSPEEPKEPANVALIREALSHVGLTPDGVTLLSMMSKWEVYRTAYKATFKNNRGQYCYLKWRVDNIFGTQVPAMPICESVAIGEGNEVRLPIYKYQP